jgi:hypothetical protein
LLFFALLLTTFLIGTEGGRDVPKKDAVYSPQTFLGLGLGWPFLGGCPFSGFPGGLGLGGLIPGLGGLIPGLGGRIPGLGGLIPGIGGGQPGPKASIPGLGGLIPGIGGGQPGPKANINGVESTPP